MRQQTINESGMSGEAIAEWATKGGKNATRIAEMIPDPLKRRLETAYATTIRAVPHSAENNRAIT